MIKVSDFLNALRFIVINRKTYYNNRFPYNCGYIHPNGELSFDCIGLVKSVINNIGIAHLYKPAGYYVTPGQVIPDTTEIDILNLCSGVVWGNFANCTAGEYLYMNGHGGVFVGDLFGASSSVNVIECTTGWGCNGVVASWVDSDGTRRDMKGGTPLGKWEAHGKLSKYIEYTQKNGLQQDDAGNWHYYKNGVIDRTRNSIDKNKYGWWKTVNGDVDFSYNGLAQNEAGWFFIKNGKVDFSYNGFVPNAYGIWVVKNGTVDFSYKGKYRYSGYDFKIKGGKMVK